MPATGVSIGSVMSPVATRQRPRHSNSSSPVGRRATDRAGTARRRAGTGDAPSGCGSRSRSAIGARPRPITGRHQRPVAGREAEVTSSGPSTSGRDGRARGRAVGRRTRHRVRPRPTGRPARPPGGRAADRPVGQAQRHVAQVDEQAAQAAGDVDREVAAAGRRAGPCRGSWNSATAVSPGGRSTSSRPPGTRSSSVVPPPAWTVEAAGGPPGPQPGRGHDAAQRREQVVGEVGQDERAAPSGRGSRRAAQQPGVVEGELAGARPADDVDDGQGDGRRAAPTTRRRRRRRRGPGGRPRGDRASCATSRPSAARAAAMPQRGPLAGRIGPRRDAQLAQPVAQAVPVRGHRRPDEHAVDDRVVRVVGGDGGGRHDGQSAAAPARRRPTAWPSPGPTASWPSTIVSTRRSRTSARAWVAAPIARRGSSTGRRARAGARASGSSAARPPARRPARAATAPGRAPTSPNAARPSDMPPARMIGSSGRRSATAATSDASSPMAARSSGRGGSPAPASMASTAGSRSRRVMASGSTSRRWPTTVRQPLRSARGDERGERPFRAGDDGQPRRPAAADLEPRQLGSGRHRSAPSDPRRPGRRARHAR